MAYYIPEIGERPPGWYDGIKWLTKTYGGGTAILATEGKVVQRINPPPCKAEKHKWYVAGYFDYCSYDEPSDTIDADHLHDLEEYCYKMVRYIHGPGETYYKIYKVTNYKDDEWKDEDDTAIFGFVCKKYKLITEIFCESDYTPHLHNSRFYEGSESDDSD